MNEAGQAIAGSYHVVEREPVSPWPLWLMIKRELARLPHQPDAGNGGSIAVLLDNKQHLTMC